MTKITNLSEALAAVRTPEGAETLARLAREMEARLWAEAGPEVPVPEGVVSLLLRLALEGAILARRYRVPTEALAYFNRLAELVPEDERPIAREVVAEFGKEAVGTALRGLVRAKAEALRECAGEA